MQGVIYDNYGIYPTEINNLKFAYGQQTYYVFFTEKSEEDIKILVQLNDMIKGFFADRVANIIMNKQKKYLTSYQSVNMILITINPSAVSFKDLIVFHNAFKNQFSSQKFNIKALQKLWEERFEYIEKEAVPAIRADVDEYNTILEVVFFSYGLADNALSYLADIKEDLGEMEIFPTIAHIRLPTLDCLTFFNPLNYYLDHTCRDLAELYCNKIITLEELEKLIYQYQYNRYDASLLMARILYPSGVFDLFEDLHMQKNDIRRALLSYHFKMKDEIIRIKNIHRLLIKKYQIRPIGWLLT